MDRKLAIKLLKQHEGEIRARGVTRLALFGSTVREDTREDSDVDIVVDIEPGRKFSLIDLASLRVLLCDVFGCEADVVIREDLRPRFREEIERDTVRVL